MRVKIIDPKHPHFGESGTLTGRAKTFVFAPGAEPMMEIRLEDCPAGVDGCFAAEKQFSRQR